jgi:ferritin-like metal-binding protein YciE
VKIKESSLQYLQGYLDARKDASPRPAYRIIRSDNKVMEETADIGHLSIGQVAGWATAEQYEIAAQKALAQAAAIRARHADNAT